MERTHQRHLAQGHRSALPAPCAALARHRESLRAASRRARDGLGCGGGFPGIPLAILFPEARFTLVDSIGKKIRVVDEVIRATGLNKSVPYTAGPSRSAAVSISSSAGPSPK